jgi:hypothetical protein
MAGITCMERRRVFGQVARARGEVSEAGDGGAGAGWVAAGLWRGQERFNPQPPGHADVSRPLDDPAV